LRLQFSIYREHCVEKARLIGKTNWLGAVERRPAYQAAQRGQAGCCRDEGGLRRTRAACKVGTERDVGGSHGLKGIAMGWWRLVYNQVNPIMEILRPIPPLAWIPLSILWFGIGDAQNQFIIFLGMFFPILINTIVGVKNVDPNLVRAARSLGAPEYKVLSRIVLKGSLPQIITGVRIGLGVGWMALVAAELVGANSGLGFLINDARSMLRTDTIVVGMLTIGLVGLLIDTAIRTLGRKFLPWSLALSK